MLLKRVANVVEGFGAAGLWAGDAEGHYALLVLCCACNPHSAVEVFGLIMRKVIAGITAKLALCQHSGMLCNLTGLCRCPG